MLSLTITDFPEDIERAFLQRAKANGNSPEQEAHRIIAETVRPAEQVKIGSELAAFGRKYGGLDLDITRDQTPIEPATFE